jgi:hypothetical protein
MTKKALPKDRTRVAKLTVCAPKPVVAPRQHFIACRVDEDISELNAENVADTPEEATANFYRFHGFDIMDKDDFTGNVTIYKVELVGNFKVEPSISLTKTKD